MWSLSLLLLFSSLPPPGGRRHQLGGGAAGPHQAQPGREDLRQDEEREGAQGEAAREWMGIREGR